jgi:hypothetical protein
MRTSTWLVSGALLLCACNKPTYLSELRPLETQSMAMGGAAADNDLYVLPVRQPSDAERMALDAERTKLALPEDVPWVGTRDFAIEIEWSIKNLDTTPAKATLGLTGGNEFGDYDPMLYVNLAAAQADQVVPPPLLGGTPIDLQAGEVRTGVFREDDLQEAAIDLEVITRFPPPGGGMNTPFIVIQHDSRVSSVGLEAVPPKDVTPAMVRLAFHLSATGHVVLDYTVRVRDRTGKLARPTDPDLYVSTDAMLQAPAAPMPATMPATMP